jgi:hypothetical protein
LSGSCPWSRAVATACVSCPGFHPSASLTADPLCPAFRIAVDGIRAWRLAWRRVRCRPSRPCSGGFHRGAPPASLRPRHPGRLHRPRRRGESRPGESSGTLVRALTRARLEQAREGEGQQPTGSGRVIPTNCRTPVV